MSDYIKKQAAKHKVVHDFSGKRHFFKVYNERGEEHLVSIDVMCDCQYMGVQGVANSEVCSHIIAVLQDAIKHGHINKTGDKNLLLQTRRRECANLVRPSNRKINEVRISENETPMHREMKLRICAELKALGKDFITEAIFETGGRADILVLDDMRCIEIMTTEEEESIEKKKETYPKGLVMDVIKIKR